MKKLNFTLILGLFFIIGCRNSVNNPELDTSIPGTREYSWKVDTLKLDPMYFLNDIWGSSPNDVWAIGSAGMWHFNGTIWNVDRNFPAFSQGHVFGFSSEEIWATSGNRIFHYNGNGWYYSTEFNFAGYPFVYLNSIWGDSPNNVFVVGAVCNPNSVAKAIILKYDGSKWDNLNIPEIEAGFFSIFKDSKGSGKYYLSGEKVLFDTTTSPVTIRGYIEKLFEFDGQSDVREIYSSPNEFRIANLLDGRVYFSASEGDKIWKFNNNQFEIWKDFFPSNYSIGNLWGRSEKDVFIWSSNKTNYNRSVLTHYNGTDVQSLFEAERFNNCTVLEKDIFIIIDGSVRGIAHGKLIN